MEQPRRNTHRSLKIHAVAMLVAVMLAGAGTLQAQTPTGPIEDLTQAILRLPYYGPFDAIGVSYDKGTVTLTGSAYALGLKRDAEHAVKSVAGVDTVINNIEALPASRNDDELRWRTFYAIYTNDFLSRYYPGVGMLWGHRGEARRAMQFGLEPFGNYPIHIIVKNGHITLLGMVDNEADKTAAFLTARGVSGSFSVENRLTVRTTS